MTYKPSELLYRPIGQTNLIFVWFVRAALNTLKSLRVAVMICAFLVITHTHTHAHAHRQLLTG